MRGGLASPDSHFIRISPESVLKIDCGKQWESIVAFLGMERNEVVRTMVTAEWRSEKLNLGHIFKASNMIL